MKVYALPKGLEAPEPDYKNYDREKEFAAEDAHRARVRAWLKANGYTGKNSGRIYREGVADGHAEYMFAEGSKSFLFHLPYGDGYQSRTVGGMTKASVLKLMGANDRLDNYFEGLDNQKKSFWDSRVVGEIIHYHNSFGQFIRGEVVIVNNVPELKPTALVGKWRESDLPRRARDGTVMHGYHVKQIINGESWQPSDSCVYESPTYSDSYKSYGDPRAMPAINLDLPELEADEIRRINREVLIKEVVKFASFDNRDNNGDDSLEVMQKMANLLNAYLEIQ